MRKMMYVWIYVLLKLTNFFVLKYSFYSKHQAVSKKNSGMFKTCCKTVQLTVFYGGGKASYTIKVLCLLFVALCVKGFWKIMKQFNFKYY